MRRRAHPDRARMAVIAALPREGRVMRQIRRRFIAGGGKPLCVGDLLPWVYPELTRWHHWHRSNCRRALVRYAIPIGRSRKQGTPIIWAPRPRNTDATWKKSA
jgi:hypothetical protein